MRLVLPTLDLEVSRKKIDTWNLLDEPEIIMRRRSDKALVEKKPKTKDGQWLDGWIWAKAVERIDERVNELYEEYRELWEQSPDFDIDNLEGFNKFLTEHNYSRYEEVSDDDIDNYILKQNDDGSFEEIPFTPPRSQTKEIIINTENLLPKTFLSRFFIETTYELFAKKKKKENDSVAIAKLWKVAKEWIAQGTMGVFANFTWGRGSPKRYYVIVYPLALKDDNGRKVAVERTDEADSFVWVMHTTAVGLDYPNSMEIPKAELEPEKPIVQTAQSLTSIIGG